MKTTLDEILDSTRSRVAARRQDTNVAGLVESANNIRSTAVPHRFRTVLERKGSLNVIAEFKKASPSKGVINDRLDPVTVGRLYEDGGACAISVLTEEKYFLGSMDDLSSIRRTVSVPVLRKDFVVDELQIYEAAAAGADAVLLIVAALNADELMTFKRIAEDELGMDALVEVHTRDEMQSATDLGAGLIGVNNRNLHSFETSLDVSRDLIDHAPPGAILISESGLRMHADLVELNRLGYAGFLIGETLMRSDRPDVALKTLLTGDGA
jgi:indole-3-glycerol phosphate synthase